MKEQKGIKRVVSLLADDEVAEFYPGFSVDATMQEAFGPTGYVRKSLAQPDSHAVISAAFKSAREAGDPIVIHCSAGETRASLGWYGCNKK